MLLFARWLIIFFSPFKGRAFFFFDWQGETYWRKEEKAYLAFFFLNFSYSDILWGKKIHSK